jgi:hypothetical protein
MHRNLIPLPLRRPLAGLLVCALLLTQALGQLHQVLHGHMHAHGQVQEVDEHGGPQDLFVHDIGSAECQIFDQLSHADGVGFGYIEPGPAPPAVRPAPRQQAPKVAAEAAGYLARGPPRAA